MPPLEIVRKDSALSQVAVSVEGGDENDIKIVQVGEKPREFTASKNNEKSKQQQKKDAKNKKNDEPSLS